MARRVLGSAALLVVASFISLAAHASGSCLQTRVTDVFVSPDGKVQKPGIVKICPYWTISPSLRLSRVSLDGRMLGIWMVRAGEGGRFDDAGHDVVLRRLPQGRVALANFYWPGEGGNPEAPGLAAAQLRTVDEPWVASALLEAGP
jgi:hypothetical protein